MKDLKSKDKNIFSRICGTLLVKSLSKSHAAAIVKIVIFTSRLEIDNLPCVHVAHGRTEMGKRDAQRILKSAVLLKSFRPTFGNLSFTNLISTTHQNAFQN